jgi:hypothetical protein
VTDSERLKAGAVILRDIELFNRAVVFMNEEILPVVHAEVEDAIKAWTEDRGWSGGGYGDVDFESLWVAPRHWQIEGDMYSAWFELRRREGHVSDSYQIADMFGVGQTQFGFRFRVDHGRFGGKIVWNAFSRGIGDIAQHLAERGWTHEGKGVFFRPLVLPAALMLEAWESEDWAVALGPLDSGLNALADDGPIFDDLIARAGPRDV